MWILIIFIILVLILLAFSKVILNSIFGKRCEGNPNLKYFTVDDFEELEAKEIEFKSNKNQILRGYIYTNKNIEEYKGLIVFVHGMGAGHLSYTTEINTFTKNGYKVLAYDNTGTCRSEGKSLNGFYQAVYDLDSCLKFVENDEELSKYDVSLVGHSWGAYTVCNAITLDHYVKKVVAISGPNSFTKLMESFLGVFGKLLKPFISFWTFLSFGFNGLKSVDKILEFSETQVLVLHGDIDKTAKLECSIAENVNKRYKNDNIKVIIYKDKYHNVYQTRESEKYLNDVFDKIGKLPKEYKGEELENKQKELYSSIDYKLITEEDLDVMKDILNFLDK